MKADRRDEIQIPPKDEQPVNGNDRYSAMKQIEEELKKISSGTEQKNRQRPNSTNKPDKACR